MSNKGKTEGMEDRVYTRAEYISGVQSAEQSLAAKIHEGYKVRFEELSNRATAAEDNAVKNIGLLQQAEQKVDELRGRVDRRNNTIVHLKAEIYDRDQLITNMLKGMVDCDELKSFIKVIREA